MTTLAPRLVSFKVFETKAAALPDLLNWATLVDDGIVLGKDGSVMAGYFYRGQDIASSTDEERNYITARVNAALARLGSGWVMWQDAVRMPAPGYTAAEASHFPDRISALIDAERRTQFMREGAHFESEYTLILMYTPPLRRNSRVADLVYDDDASKGAAPADLILKQFRRSLEDIEDTLGDAVKMRRMGGYEVTDRTGRKHLQDELINYLHFCLTGDTYPINVPACPMYMDSYIGGQELWPGDTPRIGERFIACIGLEGFPAASHPGILDVLDHLAIAYRWSTRMIYLDQHEAVANLNKFRRKWKQKVRGFWSQVFRTQGGAVDEDALLMATQAENALTDAKSALVTFGYYTPVIVLMDESRQTLEENARAIVREINREGFTARIETVNTMEAWLGSLPGHPRPNVRRPLLHTLNLADLLPLASVWTGQDTCPCPYYPPNSPPLLHAATAGATPFRLNLHVGDLGHTLVFGPTGAGKSTLLGIIAAQFRRYPGATITAFDKGNSMLALVKACGGQHYDLAGDTGSPDLCPLQFLNSDSDVAWAEEWIATCFQLQVGQPATPRQKEEIHRALTLMRMEQHGRSLTDLLAYVQDEGGLRAALKPYTLDGSLGRLLDARQDGLRDASFSVFEIEQLMGLGEKNLLPVLLYLFRRFERSLTGQPALLILDEAWVMLGHPVFREKIREWLKVLRKANCSVVLATQSMSDAAKSGIFDVLLESCPTKILLPNEEADKGGTDQVMGPMDYYTMMGLNSTQIQIIKSAQKKRHYYYVSPEGRRLFDLGLGPVARSFVAVSDKQQVARVRQLATEAGDQWPYRWMEERGVNHA